MRQHTIYLTILIGLALLLTACGPAAPEPAAGQDSQGAGPSAWIDAPLPGSVYPPGPLEVVAHGGDPSGITTMELHVQGLGLVDTRTSPMGISNLMTAHFTWNAEAPGTYTLLVRARNINDEWSEFAATTIVIADGAPAGQARPTAVPTRGQAGITFDNYSATPGQIYFIGDTCGPKQAIVRIRVSGPGVASVQAYYHIGNNPVAQSGMTAEGNGWYSFVVSGGSIPGEDPDPGLGGLPVSIYFQALGSGGQSLEFSQVFGGLTDTFCSP